MGSRVLVDRSGVVFEFADCVVQCEDGVAVRGVVGLRECIPKGMSLRTPTMMTRSWIGERSNLRVPGLVEVYPAFSKS